MGVYVFEPKCGISFTGYLRDSSHYFGTFLISRFPDLSPRRTALRICCWLGMIFAILRACREKVPFVGLADVFE